MFRFYFELLKDPDENIVYDKPNSDGIDLLIEWEKQERLAYEEHEEDLLATLTEIDL